MNKTKTHVNDSYTWYVVDANNQTLGRLSTQISTILLGKNSPNYSPEQQSMNGVIVINAEKIKVTGKKETDKFSMSQVAQIIESNNAKILGLFISNIVGNKVEITVKISQSGLNDIIQTFRRYEYEIISEHQDDSYLNSLKERSDYLDKYLNI